MTNAIDIQAKTVFIVFRIDGGECLHFIASKATFSTQYYYQSIWLSKQFKTFWMNRCNEWPVHNWPVIELDTSENGIVTLKAISVFKTRLLVIPLMNWVQSVQQLFDMHVCGHLNRPHTLFVFEWQQNDLQSAIDIIWNAKIHLSKGVINWKLSDMKRQLYWCSCKCIRFFLFSIAVARMLTHCNAICSTECGNNFCGVNLKADVLIYWQIVQEFRCQGVVE